MFGNQKLLVPARRVIDFWGSRKELLQVVHPLKNFILKNRNYLEFLACACDNPPIVRWDIYAIIFPQILFDQSKCPVTWHKTMTGLRVAVYDFVKSSTLDKVE